MYVYVHVWFGVDDDLIARDVRGHDHTIGELRRERLDLALVSYELFYQRICFRHD